MTEKTNYTFEDCINKCESIIDRIYQEGCQSIHLYSLKTFIYGMIDIHNKTTIELQDEVNQFRAIGTVEEFKALKEEVELYRNLDKTNFSDGYNKAIDEFANTLIPRLTDAIYQKDVESMTNLINDVARELKAGGKE